METIRTIIIALVYSLALYVVYVVGSHYLIYWDNSKIYHESHPKYSKSFNDYIKQMDAGTDKNIIQASRVIGMFVLLVVVGYLLGITAKNILN